MSVSAKTRTKKESIDSAIKAKVVNLSNGKESQMDLNPEVFGVEYKPKVIKLALDAFLANRRIAIAHTKTRAEVAGNNKKIKPQKHTGGARQGTRKAPHWVGGGVAFGPRNDRNFSKDLNKKVRRLALLSALSERLRRGELSVIEGLEMESPKTKDALNMLAKANIATYRSGFVIDDVNKNFYLSIRNIEGVAEIDPNSLNAYSVMVPKLIFIDSEVIRKLNNKVTKDA